MNKYLILSLLFTLGIFNNAFAKHRSNFSIGFCENKIGLYSPKAKPSEVFVNGKYVPMTSDYYPFYTPTFSVNLYGRYYKPEAKMAMGMLWMQSVAENRWKASLNNVNTLYSWSHGAAFDLTIDNKYKANDSNFAIPAAFTHKNPKSDFKFLIENKKSALYIK